MHIKTSTQCTQWGSQAGAHWGMCPSNLRLCSASGYKLSAPKVLLSIANRVLKIHEVLQIEQLSIAILYPQVNKVSYAPLISLFIVSSEVNVHRAHIRTKACSKCSRFNATVLTYNICLWLSAKIPKFLGEHVHRHPLPSPIASVFYKEILTNIVCPCCALALAMSWLRHWVHLTLMMT